MWYQLSCGCGGCYLHLRWHYNLKGCSMIWMPMTSVQNYICFTLHLPLDRMSPETRVYLSVFVTTLCNFDKGDNVYGSSPCHQRQKWSPCASARASVHCSSVLETTPCNVYEDYNTMTTCFRGRQWLLAILMRVTMCSAQYLERMSPETIGEPLCLSSCLGVSNTMKPVSTRPQHSTTQLLNTLQCK